MEFPDKEKIEIELPRGSERKRDLIQLLMVIGLYLAIIVLIFAIIVIVKNVEEIKSDPIIYGIEKNNFQRCKCFLDDGNDVEYNSTSIVFNKYVSGFGGLETDLGE